MEWDFRHFLGIDLYEFARGDRPWSQMYRLMTRLPRYSHFHAALMEDDESVQQLMSDRDTESRQKFGYAEWTYERELLTTICDLLQQFHASFIQANSEKGTRPTVEPMPRPSTALDRLQARRVIEDHHNLVAMMRPRPS